MKDIEQIYQENALAVYKYVFCLCQNKDIAEEIVQETFVIAVKEINHFRGDCKVLVWLCQIAKHIWYKEIKRKKKNSIISIDEMTENIDFHSVEENFLEKQDKLELFKSIQKLEDNLKEVLYLRIMGNLTFGEIGEILNKTPNWARVTFYRGKEKIKEEWNNGKKDGM